MPTGDADRLASIDVDPDEESVTVAFDEGDAARDEVERSGTEVASIEIETTDRCTVHVDREGGRSCESCARSLERRLRTETGVTDANVSFQGGVVHVEYDGDLTDQRDLEREIRNFGVEPRGGPGDTSTVDESTLQREILFVALTFVGMMGGLIGGWVGASAAVVWTSYGGAYLFGGWYGLWNAVETLRHRAVDIDLLMILAALGALVIGAPFEGAMLLFLFSLSNALQHYAVGRSRDAIRSLMEIRPESARLVRDGEEVTVPIDDVAVGDVFIVRPGDRIPLDGTVQSGESTVNQASLTGESVPVTKGPGDEIFGGTITENGSLTVTVTRTASESAIAKLIHMVEEAQSRRAPTQRLIDRLEQPYVLAVFAMTLAAIAIPISFGGPFDSTFYRAMTLMVAASPCAVVISTPAAVLSAITAGARNGVLFKGGEYVETAATIDAIALDKTGTLTEGDSRLTDVTVRPDARLDGENPTTDQVLRWAAAVQSRSEHHLAEATVDAAIDRSLDVPDATGFTATVGMGVRATVDGRRVHIGNRRYFETLSGTGTDIEGLETGTAALAELEAAGNTSVLIAREIGSGTETDTDGGEQTETESGSADRTDATTAVSVVGWLAYTDTIRPEAAGMIESLRGIGVEHVVMLTGDNERVARAIAEEVGIDEVHAELLPEQKVESIETLVARYDGVAMVGDGVNDAPALARADLGIGMGGAGTDVALETADVVLMSDELDKIPYALGLGRETRRKLHTNLAIAFGAIAIMIVAILTRGIPLPLAVIGHEGSTVLVSLNGLRLLRFHG